MLTEMNCPSREEKVLAIDWSHVVAVYSRLPHDMADYEWFYFIMDSGKEVEIKFTNSESSSGLRHRIYRKLDEYRKSTQSIQERGREPEPII